MKSPFKFISFLFLLGFLQVPSFSQEISKETKSTDPNKLYLPDGSEFLPFEAMAEQFKKTQNGTALMSKMGTLGADSKADVKPSSAEIKKTGTGLSPTLNLKTDSSCKFKIQSTTLTVKANDLKVGSKYKKSIKISPISCIRSIVMPFEWIDVSKDEYGSQLIIQIDSFDEKGYLREGGFFITTKTNMKIDFEIIQEGPEE